MKATADCAGPRPVTQDVGEHQKDSRLRTDTPGERGPCCQTSQGNAEGIQQCESIGKGMFVSLGDQAEALRRHEWQPAVFID